MTDSYISQWESMTKEELTQTPAYLRLTDKAKSRAGTTARQIVKYLQTKVYPRRIAMFTSLSAFVWMQIRRSVHFTEFGPIDRLHDTFAKISQTKPDTCRNLTPGESALPMFILWANRSDFHVANFIPLYINTNTDDWRAHLHHIFPDALMYSRLNYIYHGSYLPIVVLIDIVYQKGQPEYGQHMDGHAVSYIFVPNNSTVYWNRIFVDSSGSGVEGSFGQTVDYIETFMDSTWLKFILRNRTYQTDIITDLDFPERLENDLDTTYCVRDYQGNMPTCSYWCFGFIVTFLYNYEKHSQLLVDNIMITYWCQKFGNELEYNGQRRSFFHKLNYMYIMFCIYAYNYVLHPAWKIYKADIQSRRSSRIAKAPTYNVDVMVAYFKDSVSRWKLQENEKIYTALVKSVRMWNLFDSLTVQKLYALQASRPSRKQTIKVKKEKIIH